MRRALEYYGFVAVSSIAALAMLYAVLIPLQVAPRVAAAAAIRPQKVLPKPVTPRSGVPSRIVIPALSIDIPVKVGEFDYGTGTWTSGDDAEAYYANTSVPANDTNGRTLIYGHARWGIFGALPDLQYGAEVEVYTDTGYKFRYRYVSVKEVMPTDTSVFTSEGKPELILQTCAGPWDSYRALYTMTFVSGGKL